MTAVGRGRRPLVSQICVSPLDGHVRRRARVLISLSARNARPRAVGIVAANLWSRKRKRNPLVWRGRLILSPDFVDPRWRQHELAAARLPLDRGVCRNHSHACEQRREDAIAVESRWPRRSVAFAHVVDFRASAQQAIGTAHRIHFSAASLGSPQPQRPARRHRNFLEQPDLGGPSSSRAAETENTSPLRPPDLRKDVS